MARTAPLLLLLAAAAGCGARDAPESTDVPVRVGMVALDSNNVPVVVLEEEDGPRLLPIWIGIDAAHSISAEMKSQRPPRPNTHDLAKQLVQGLDGEIARVIVTKLQMGTYYATVDLMSRGRIVEIDARPSDAIAIALRAKAPIFVRSSVFDEAGDVAVPESYGRRIDLPGDLDARRAGSPPATIQRSL